jgi:hypothetical protein
LKERNDPVRWRHIDDVIVALHEHGENLFQACVRAAAIPGATSEFVILRAELAETGRVMLESGETIELPRLDAAGVALICNYELEIAVYAADRVVIEQPRVEEPRVPVRELWPALQANSFCVGREDRAQDGDCTPLVRLKEATGIAYATLHRISTGGQKTVSVRMAITLLLELGCDEQARSLEDDPLEHWISDRHRIDNDHSTYLAALTRFAQHALVEAPLQPSERQALQDILWISGMVQRKSLLGTTIRDRLAESTNLFRLAHKREPLPLSRQLQRSRRYTLANDSARAATAARELAKGVHTTTGPITAQAVTMRTHRLRRAARLPPGSKPKRYRPRPALDSHATPRRVLVPKANPTQDNTHG